MASKVKTTITVDPDLLAEAREAADAPSASAAVEVALVQLVERARTQRDVAAYRRRPPTDDDLGLAATPHDWDTLADDTDWEAEWPEP